MARLWKNTDGVREGKYLVLRRDGTVPSWPWFVLGAADPNAPAGLRAYAAEAEKNGYDPEYVQDIRDMADQWQADLKAGKVPKGDPDAPRHRQDNPFVVLLMRQGKGA